MSYDEALFDRECHAACLTSDALQCSRSCVSACAGLGESFRRGTQSATSKHSVDGHQALTRFRKFSWRKGQPQAMCYSVEQAENLGLPSLPHNPFRDLMCLRGKQGRQPRVASSRIVAAGERSTADESGSWYLVQARTVAEKSNVLRYKIRWYEIAILHRSIETSANRWPVTETLDRIHRAVRDRWYVNPSPGCLSRAQFVATISSILDSCDISALHRLYSTFDPDGTDRVRYVDVMACLLVIHKPEVHFRAVSGQFCSEMTKDNRQVTWRFLRRLLTLYVDAGGGHGLSLEQTERLFQLCATSDEHVLEMSSAFAAHLRNCFGNNHPRGDEMVTEDTFHRYFCTAWTLLDMFNVHMN
ncbi:unnamed protein product, partial [Ascophyllum nodosum]